MGVYVSLFVYIFIYCIHIVIMPSLGLYFRIWCNCCPDDVGGCVAADDDD